MRLHHAPTPPSLCPGPSNPSGSQAIDHYDPILDFDVPMLHISSLTPADPVQGRLDHDHPYVANDFHEGQWPPDGRQDPLDYQEDDQDLDTLEYDNEETGVGPLPLEPNENDPDPFFVERENRQNAPDFQDLPRYLLVIYAMVSWLHLQFYLPRIACNAMLAIFARLFTFLNPRIRLPFVTLISAMRSLGVDSHIELLAVCPNC